MTKLLKNKVALVTGAGSGIGQEIANQLGAEGARVVVSDINDRAGHETVARLKDRGIPAIYVHADTAKPAMTPSETPVTQFFISPPRFLLSAGLLSNSRTWTRLMSPRPCAGRFSPSTTKQRISRDRDGFVAAPPAGS